MNKIKYDWFSSYNLILVAGIIFLVTGTVVGINLYDDVLFAGSKFFSWLNSQNQMVAGAFSLWALGVGSYLLRSVPEKVWGVIKKQITVTLTMNNIDDVYDNFLNWYEDTGRSKSARTLVAKNEWNDSDYYGNGVGDEKSVLRVSAGYGTHYFTYGGKFFQFTRTEKDATQTKEVKETLFLKTFGRTQNQFHQLLEEITPEKDSEGITDIYRWHVNGRWNKLGSQMSRRYDSVILPAVQKETIVTHIQTFMDKRDWYIENGIPYRTGVILHGIPGTGKTSLIKALCDKFEKDLYVISLNSLTDSTFEEALTSLPRNALALIEDIDTYSVAKSRAAKNEESKGSHELSVDMGVLTLSGILNGIDGIMSSDGRIIIATTNHLEKLDPALVRKGRFNLTVELGHLTQDCVVTFLNRFYSDVDLAGMKFRKDIVPADMQAQIMDHIDDPQAVIKWAKGRVKQRES